MLTYVYTLCSANCLGNIRGRTFAMEIIASVHTMPERVEYVAKRRNWYLAGIGRSFVMQNRLPYTNHKDLTVINLLGGPGVGKSTTAAGLFYEMKKKHFKVELIHEWIKGEGVWEDRPALFGDQDYIFAHQHRLQRRLIGHDIEYVITDSPILLSLFYMPPDFPESFVPFVREVFDSYDNLNIFIDRNPEMLYTQEGRNENMDQAIQIDANIRAYFDNQGIDRCNVMAGDSAVIQALSAVRSHQINKQFAPVCRI